MFLKLVWLRCRWFLLTTLAAFLIGVAIDYWFITILVLLWWTAYFIDERLKKNGMARE